MDIDSEDVTRLLHAVRDGGDAAREDLASAVYQQLHLIASSQMSRERPGHTLQPTALVNEAYMRLIKDGVPYAVLGFARDITARREAMEDLDEERRLRKALLDNVPDCIALVLKKGSREIVASNKAA